MLTSTWQKQQMPNGETGSLSDHLQVRNTQNDIQPDVIPELHGGGLESSGFTKLWSLPVI